MKSNLITDAWSPKECWHGAGAANHHCAGKGLRQNPTGCRASIITDARMQERRCRSQPRLGTNTRLEDKTMRVQWHIHKKWLTKIQWMKSSQIRLSRIHAVLTATCHTRVVTNGKRLRTNGEWQLSTSCAQVQWRMAKHKPIALAKLTDLTLQA